MKALFRDKEFTDFIIEMNTIEQLFNKGINSDGQKLSDIGGGYSPVTIYGDKRRGIIGKIDKGLPIDHITLFDEGKFYKSFRTKYLNENFGTIQIIANTIKGDDDLAKEWGNEIIGLTEDSMEKLVEMAKKKIPSYVREFYTKNLAA